MIILPDDFFKPSEVSDDEKDILKQMLYRVSLEEWECLELYEKIYSDISRDQFNKIERYLLDNTPCPIAGGSYYSQGDIARKIKRET